jgi:hypothetical protein
MMSTGTNSTGVREMSNENRLPNTQELWLAAWFRGRTVPTAVPMIHRKQAMGELIKKGYLTNSLEITPLGLEYMEEHHSEIGSTQ